MHHVSADADDAHPWSARDPDALANRAPRARIFRAIDSLTIATGSDAF